MKVEDGGAEEVAKYTVINNGLLLFYKIGRAKLFAKNTDAQMKELSKNE